YAGNWMWKDLLIAGIILAAWPVQEWLIHVFILHLKPLKLFGKRYDSVFGSKHRQHHREPWKPELIFIPSPGRYGATVILPIAWLTFLPFEQGLTGLAVYLVLTLNYEWMHFLCHTSYKPRTWYYRRIWQNHRLHHFRNEKYWYGVSMLSGDYILRTHPDAKSTPLSDTVMTLGVEEHERDELTGTDAAGA
ncbi:sterol desaturase family protein, partial [bacterium]|nr:sterol desaturase family protein [bacterium]